MTAGTIETVHFDSEGVRCEAWHLHAADDRLASAAGGQAPRRAVIAAMTAWAASRPVWAPPFM